MSVDRVPLTPEQRAAKAERNRAWYQRHRSQVLARVAAYQAARRKPKLTPEEWFWSHVDRSGGPGSCWPWIGPRTRVPATRYAKVRWQGRMRPSTHVALSLGRGIEVGPGEQARHVVCDNPPCCNPAHLEPGVHADNMADKVAKGRQTKGDAHHARRHPERLARGLTHPRGAARLNWDAVAEIRHRVAGGETQAAIAAAFDVDPSTISRLMNGESWAAPRV